MGEGGGVSLTPTGEMGELLQAEPAESGMQKAPSTRCFLVSGLLISRPSVAQPGRRCFRFREFHVERVRHALEAKPALRCGQQIPSTNGLATRSLHRVVSCPRMLRGDGAGEAAAGGRRRGWRVRAHAHRRLEGSALRRDLRAGRGGRPVPGSLRRAAQGVSGRSG